jgi:DUF1680 family protein
LYSADDDLGGGVRDYLDPTIVVNGKPADYKFENGYAVIEREWKKADMISFEFLMEIRELKAKQDVKYDNQRIAIQRGPLVYCVEGADNKDGVWNIVVPEKTKFTEIDHKVLDEPVIALQAEALSAVPGENGHGIKMEKRKITAIPYYCWANRGANAMQVWLPTKIREIKINYASKYEDGGNY